MISWSMSDLRKWHRYGSSAKCWGNLLPHLTRLPIRHWKFLTSFLEKKPKRMWKVGHDVGWSYWIHITSLQEHILRPVPSSGKILSVVWMLMFLHFISQSASSVQHVRRAWRLIDIILPLRFVETGSKIDEVIFEEFKEPVNIGTCTRSVKLSQKNYPASYVLNFRYASLRFSDGTKGRNCGVMDSRNDERLMETPGIKMEFLLKRMKRNPRLYARSSWSVWTGRKNVELSGCFMVRCRLCHIVENFLRCFLPSDFSKEQLI